MDKKGKDGVKVYLLAQECHFLQPASHAGRGGISSVKAEQTLRMSNLFGKKVCSRCSMGGGGELF